MLWSNTVPEGMVVEATWDASYRVTRVGNQLPREGVLWLLAAAVIFTTGFVKGINLLVFLAYLLIGLWVINWRRVWRDLRRVCGRRWPTGQIVAGERAQFRIDVTALGNAFIRGVVIEEGDPAGHKRWIILRVAGNSPIRIDYERMFEKRGRYATGPLLAHSHYPFGLVGGAIELAPSIERLILPRVGRVDVDLLRRWLSSSTRGDGRTRRLQSHLSLHDADLHGLRDFRPGDSPRWIHWRSSARRNRILVREFEESGTSSLVLVVEPYLPEKPSDVQREHFEALVSMSATICCDWCRDRQSRLTVVILGATVEVHTGQGGDFGHRLMETFAVLEGLPVVLFKNWFEQAPQLNHATPILVLSSRTDSDVASQAELIAGRPVPSVSVDEMVPWYVAPPIMKAVQTGVGPSRLLTVPRALLGQ